MPVARTMAVSLSSSSSSSSVFSSWLGGYACSVRRPYAHYAVVELEPGGDERAPGAAITVALCGHWGHEPPCPLSPHHTAARRDGVRVQLRVLFAVEPGREEVVRKRIGEALAASELRGPDGQATRWRLVTSAPGPVRAEESAHASRLVAS